MPKTVDKVIVTNQSALQKYGPAGLTQIVKAINDLIAADKNRGLVTQLVYLDNAANMKKLKAARVTNASDPKQNKTAIDGVFKALMPDYLVLLGAIDVIPHQDMVNPVYDPAHPDADPDPTAWGDLPYACEHAYSKDIKDFTGPTRVVGRLPDITHGNDPAYLVGLLSIAANYQSRPHADYAGYLGISAAVWQGSTTLSLQNVFGNATNLQVVPPSGPPWNGNLLGQRSHFINCHGAPADPHFYGQPVGQDQYPIAHDATQVMGNIQEGTVLAAECCYGAELYDPTATGASLGMCNTYLQSKAYGYFGSSTVAYGPSNSNDQADLMCQYFCNHVLTGASLGRAALQARQDYVQSHGVMHPVDLKTLAQYSLMADPAIQAVQTPAPKIMSTKRAIDPGAARQLRRARLMQVGLALGSTVSRVTLAKGKVAGKVQKLLTEALRDAGLDKLSIRTFAVTTPSPAKYSMVKGLTKAIASTTAVHLAIGKVASAFKVPQVVVAIALEQDGQFVVKRSYSR